MHSEQKLNWYKKHGIQLPESIPHVKDEDIKKKLIQLKPVQYYQQGNKLVGVTEEGTKIVNFIPTDRLFDGVDEKGLPKFKKVLLSK